MLSNHLILCHPLLLLPSIFPSIRVLSNVSALHSTWPKYWSWCVSTPHLILSSQQSYKSAISPWIFADEKPETGRMSISNSSGSCCSVARSVLSHSLLPHGLQHARLFCPSPSPGACSNSCPLSQWCHPTIFSSVVPFSSCFQSFPASGSFLMSQLFASGGQNIGASASPSVLPANTQDWSALGWTGWISLQSKDSQESSPTLHFKSINSSVLSFLYSPTLTTVHDHWKNHSLDLLDFVGKVRSLLFNMLSRLVITFIPRSKHLLIWWLQSPSSVGLEPEKKS